MNVLVTGGAGFIGSHVVDQLLQANHNVVVIDDGSSGNMANVPREAKLYSMSIMDDQLTEIFEQEQPDAVIHMAAQIDVQRSIREPIFDAEVNIVGTIRLLQCCERHEVSRFIYSSSAAAYGNPQYLPVDEGHPIEPMSAYGISKYTPERYIKMYHEQLPDLQYSILRYANVYGERQISKGEGGVVSIFIDHMLNNKRPIIYGDGNQTRDFVHVEDVARSNVLALTSEGSMTVNISTGEPTSVIELYRQLQAHTGVGDPIFSEPRTGDIEHSYLDNTKARNRLGWEPTIDLQAGLARTLAYTREAGRNSVSVLSGAY
ncbi:NAD-dependent epimerase/dehydratase family protein [Paenibacillus agilis]|uniref:UDP-glucose 4-epimerase n=1 Tax=Paenibacillus agilis TaxID=3020863 RepID=A0A559IVY8_9BACL|nr:NAD-dependent epimerase/dehydratase family protein [Paenibacillus agilis]TVX91800.1 NAD-dependent epimerase/dehydratase family protein [Paenibacillus agilis]